MDFSRNNSCDEAVGLLVTYQCNISCRYCYIHKKQDKQMTLSMAQSILEPFLDKQGKHIDIFIYGGETLLCFDTIKSLVEWAENRHSNSLFRFFASTNGTLLDSEMKRWLKYHSHVLTLGLSYDGIPAIQAYNRSSRDIDIDFFIQTWPSQPIQMTINSDAVNRMSEGVIYLLEKGANVHPNVAFEEKEWPSESISEYARQLRILMQYYASNPNKPRIKQFDHDLIEYSLNISRQHTPVRSCGAGYGLHLFDIDGKEYPCHILSPLVLNSEKSLNLAKEATALESFDSSDIFCKECPYISSCPTCIACNYLYRGDFSRRDLTHCRIMKTEVKVFIESEVARLKKIANLTPEDAAEIDAIDKLIVYEKSHKQ